MTWIRKSEQSWRKLIATAVQMGIPVPALSASLSYFDSYRSAQLPQNLTQAQRDYFGAHTYHRTDRPECRRGSYGLGQAIRKVATAQRREKLSLQRQLSAIESR